MMQILKREISLILMQVELRQIVTSLQIKNRKTHLLFVFDLNIYRKMRLCAIIKKKKHTQSLLRLLGGLRAMNGLENNIISKHLYHN